MEVQRKKKKPEIILGPAEQVGSAEFEAIMRALEQEEALTDDFKKDPDSQDIEYPLEDPHIYDQGRKPDSVRFQEMRMGQTQDYADRNKYLSEKVAELEAQYEAGVITDEEFNRELDILEAGEQYYQGQEGVPESERRFLQGRSPDQVEIPQGFDIDSKNYVDQMEFQRYQDPERELRNTEERIIKDSYDNELLNRQIDLQNKVDNIENDPNLTDEEKDQKLDELQKYYEELDKKQQIEGEPLTKPKRRVASEWSEEDEAELQMLHKELGGKTKPIEKLTKAEEEEFEQLEQELTDGEVIYNHDGIPIGKIKEKPKFVEVEGEVLPVSDKEADLGPFRRLQFEMENEDINRAQLIKDNFGHENFMMYKDDFYLKQDGEWRQINKDGLSEGDWGAMASMIPYMLGEAALAPITFMFPAAAPVTVPAGMWIGNRFRKSFSEYLGTPQVATPEEEALGIISDMSLGIVARGVGKGVKKGIGKIAKGIDERVTLPKVKKDSAFYKGKKGTIPSRVAEKYKITKPTAGQRSGDPELKKIENDLAERNPWLWGRGYRKIKEKQAVDLRNVIIKEVGDFTDDTLDPAESGAVVKRMAKHFLEGSKKRSQDLFDEVEGTITSKDINTSRVIDNLMEAMEETNLFDKAGRSVKISMLKTHIPKKQAQYVQEVLHDATEELLERLKDEKPVSYKELNTLRSNLDKVANEVYDSMPEAFKTLKDIEQKMLGYIKAGLVKPKKGVGSKGAYNRRMKILDTFNEARSTWANFRKKEEALSALKFLDKRGKVSKSGERVLSTIFSETNNVETAQEVFGNDLVKRMAKKHLTFLIKQGSKQIGENAEDRIIRSGTIRNIIDKNISVYNKALGKKETQMLMDVLDFDSQLKLSVNPSGSTIIKSKGEIINNFLSGAWNFAKAKSASLKYMQVGKRAAKAAGKAAEAGTFIKGQKYPRKHRFKKQQEKDEAERKESKFRKRLQR